MLAISGAFQQPPRVPGWVSRGLPDVWAGWDIFAGDCGVISMSELSPPSLAMQIKCVEREIAMRERAYPRWVADKKMTWAKAIAEIAAMRAALKTLKGIADANH